MYLSNVLQKHNLIAGMAGGGGLTLVITVTALIVVGGCLRIMYVR